MCRGTTANRWGRLRARTLERVPLLALKRRDPEGRLRAGRGVDCSCQTQFLPRVHDGTRAAAEGGRGNSKWLKGVICGPAGVRGVQAAGYLQVQWLTKLTPQHALCCAVKFLCAPSFPGRRIAARQPPEGIPANKPVRVVYSQTCQCSGRSAADQSPKFIP